jgi:ribosomal protein S27AE
MALPCRSIDLERRMTFWFVRPSCPKCGMSMVHTTSEDKKTYACLRCGHVETRKEKE